MASTSSEIEHPATSNQVVLRDNSRVNQTDSLQDETAGQPLGRVDTQFYLFGHNETQVSEGSEADLHKHFNDCEKNPGHKNFKPVKTFKMDDLPEGYHDTDLYELIKATADMTVRVRVKMTSPHRPEFYPGTKSPYPVYDMRNKTTLRLGTGEIDVRRFIDGRGFDASGREFYDDDGEKISSLFNKSTRTCPCTKCQHSEKPNNVWWEILLSTATHVVFDVIEASHTSCRLFFDEKDSPAVNIDTFLFACADITDDRCLLKYVTCDSLGDKLYNMKVHMSNLTNIVLDKYCNKSDVRLTFMVSHPHGSHKQVSFGQWIKNEYVSEYDTNFDYTKLTYTTATCPGSSGASVYCVGKMNVHKHNGTNGILSNCSGIGIYYIK